MLRCVICNAPCNSSIVLHEHMRSHINTVKCCRCERSFSNTVALVQHINDAHPLKTIKEEKHFRHKCSCGKGFSSKLSLEQHRESVHFRIFSQD